jgi:dUTP pyrophosphatase
LAFLFFRTIAMTKLAGLSDNAPVALSFCRLRPTEDADLALPAYHSARAAGMDVGAALPAPVVLQPGEIRLLPTGFAVAIPPGYEIQVRPRSGLAIKHGITVVNAPGTIDADYRGEIMIGLINLGPAPFPINRHDRIAQLILAPVRAAAVSEVSSLDQTVRQAGGFGHTGK